MDGLLLNTEEIYSVCANNVLAKYGRPPIPWHIKAQLMSVSGGWIGDIFHNWAKLPISREQFVEEMAKKQEIHFPECKPLPGAAKLLSDMKKARNKSGQQISLVLASSSKRDKYELKTLSPESKELMKQFAEESLILGDDPRIKGGRGKPAPDIYMLALDTLNRNLTQGQDNDIKPVECLVFEDSVLGVEAGRRAGMRVLWVPDSGLAEEYKGREQDVLAGKNDLVNIGDEHQLGCPNDGWAEQLNTLENFPYERFGIKLTD
jgi:pseudouridine 5'-phosphatase